MFSPSSAVTTASEIVPSSRSRPQSQSALAGDVTTLFSSSSPVLLSIGFAPPSPSHCPTSSYTAHHTNNNVNNETSTKKIRTTTATAGISPRFHIAPTCSSGFPPRIGGPAGMVASPRCRRSGGGSIGGFGEAGAGSSGLGWGVFEQGGKPGTLEEQQLPPSFNDVHHPTYEHNVKPHHQPLAQTVLTYNDPDLITDASSLSSPTSDSLSSLLALPTTASSSQTFEDEDEHHPPHTQALHHPLSLSYIERKHARTVTRELHLISSPAFNSLNFKASRFSNRAFDAIVFLLFWICFVVFLSALFGVGGDVGETGAGTEVGLGGLRMLPVKATS